MIDYPKKINNGRDVIVYFSDNYYLKEFGHKMNKKDFPVAAGWVKRMRNAGYSLEDMMLLVWGVTNTESRTETISFCSGFIHKLGKYRELKNKYDEFKEKQSQNKEIEFKIPEYKEDDGLDELL